MISLTDYFMRMADIAKLRSGCKRKQVGVVFVIENRVVSTGYNQAPSGVEHCADVGCTVVNGHCIRSVHAELNGILNATRAGQTLRDATAYVTTMPCLRCLMAMRNAGIDTIWYEQKYAIPSSEIKLYEEVQSKFAILEWKGDDPAKD